MIHELAVENFLSIKEKQILSFEATANKDFEDYSLIPKSNFRLSKLAILYGANSSGKTNFLKAITFLKRITSDKRTSKNENLPITPFLLDEESKSKPSNFYLSFFIQETRYIYTLSINSEYILDEKLTYYPGTQPAIIFHRYYDENNSITVVDFGKKMDIETKDKNILAGNTILNQSLLASYSFTNVYSQILNKVVNYFSYSLKDILYPNLKLLPFVAAMIEKEVDKNFVVEALKLADFGISDIAIETEIKGENIFVNDISNVTYVSPYFERDIKKKMLSEENNSKVMFKYNVSGKEFELPLASQSEGTKRYFELAGILNLLVKESSILPIDEIESSLHYELVNHFLATFLMNSDESQIICTTHNIQLLEADFIRRDSIWFCEKNEHQATELFPLTAFRLHKNVSALKSYKVGKLGATPEPHAAFISPQHT